MRQHDFSGKIIIPFFTHGGCGFDQIECDIAKECIKSIILPDFSINGTNSSRELKNWLKKIGYFLRYFIEILEIRNKIPW